MGDTSLRAITHSPGECDGKAGGEPLATPIHQTHRADALYGDPIRCIFLATWLMCTAKSAEHWDERLAATPDYRRRIRCYQLRTALQEICDHALDGDAETLDWLQGRSEQILAETV